MRPGNVFVLTKTYYTPSFCQFSAIAEVMAFDVMAYTSFSTPLSPKRRRELSAQITFSKKASSRS